MTPRARIATLALVLSLAACTGAPSGGPDADAASDAATDVDAPSPDVPASPDVATDVPIAVDVPATDAFAPAPHEQLPTLANLGGPRLLHPTLVTITFAGDPRRAELEAYAEWIVGSAWLLATGGEYGVSAGSVLGTVHRAEAAPAATSTGEIEAMLARGILDGSIPRPTAGLGDALYMVYYPATTTIDGRFATVCGPQRATSCTQWGAYHTGAHVMGLDFAYAVMADCGAAAGLTALEQVESAASHEIIEAASDADDGVRPAYQLVYDPAEPWSAFLGCDQENADLCAIPVHLTTRENGHIAQRSWSNAAVLAGGDPCVPADPALPYFNTSAAPSTVQHVAPGASVTFELHGWSLAPGPDWSLATQVVASSGTAPRLAATVTLSTRTMNNGQTATLRVTAPATAAAGSRASILLRSNRSAADTHLWVLGVASP